MRKHTEAHMWAGVWGEASIGHQVQRRVTLGGGAGHMDETRI